MKHIRGTIFAILLAIFVLFASKTLGHYLFLLTDIG